VPSTDDRFPLPGRRTNTNWTAIMYVFSTSVRCVDQTTQTYYLADRSQRRPLDVVRCRSQRADLPISANLVQGFNRQQLTSGLTGSLRRFLRALCDDANSRVVSINLRNGKYSGDGSYRRLAWASCDNLALMPPTDAALFVTTRTLHPLRRYPSAHR